jgi:putative FmdB family regulatory protein
MPLYEYRCKTCDSSFELRRSMAESSSPATCPQGHSETMRLLSSFASVGASSGGSSFPASAAPSMGGGCGGACACAH